MRLISLSLENFTTYFGKNEIDFRTTDKAPVILFLGDNGHGKTSIQMSIKWCLYGKVKKTREISDSELFNRIAFADAMSDDPTRLEVTLVWADGDDEYALTRTAMFNANSKKIVQEATLRVNGQNPVTQETIASIVNKFMAEEISHFFIFDGETQQEFDNMSNNEGGAQFIRSEIEKTLSIPVLDDAISWLSDKESKEAKILAKKSREDSALKDLNFKYEQNTRELETLEQEMKAQVQKRIEAQTKLEELEATIGDVERLQELNKKITENEAVIKFENEKQGELWSQIQDRRTESYWLPLTKILKQKQSEIHEKILANQANQAKVNELQGKIASLIELKSASVCPTCGSAHTRDEIEINSRISKLESDLSQIEILDVDEVRTNMGILDRINFDVNKQIRIRDLEKDLSAVRGRIATGLQKRKDLNDQRLLQGMGDSDLTKMFNTHADAIRKAGEADTSLKRYQEQRNDLLLQIKRQETLISKAVMITPQAAEIYHSYKYLGMLFSDLKESYVQGVRKKVEEFASESFLSVISDSKFSGISINENFGVNLTLDDGSVEPIPSTGQGKIGSISLITGIIKTSMSEGFILMDTPFVSLDLGHRGEVAKWAGSSGLRVSLFMHSGEFVYPSGVGIFGNAVSKVYRIERISENQSRVKLVSNE